MLIVVGPVESDAHRESHHPERPERVAAVLAGVDDLHLGSDLSLVPARPAGMAALHRVHSAEHLDALQRFCSAGGGPLDADTYTTATSW